MKADDLIMELQRSKTMIAIVSGEYGDVLGLVTMEDALEELVGEIYDEHDIAGEDDILFTEIAENTYLVDADMYVDDYLNACILEMYLRMYLLRWQDGYLLNVRVFLK